ncbi:hypothetical protein [Rhizobium sp. ZPR3]|uniref:ATP-binding protein n=2 Tax=unclassified Rhizobium TaxID=2613769 RepID=A0AAU7SP92_9HYPH
MTIDATNTDRVQRTFYRLTNEEVADLETAISVARRGYWRKELGWDELLKFRRVLIVSESGSGKTYECQAQQRRLWRNGEAAFFLDLSTLATDPISDMLSFEELDRLDRWQRSQSDVATFFLDSIDELKLTRGKFDTALKKLRKVVDGQLGRVRLIVTSRPVPIDRQLMIEQFPIPKPDTVVASADAFADIAMLGSRALNPDKDDRESGWANVGLLPLSTSQMRALAESQNVSNPDELLRDIVKRDAKEFAERPQDLVELCADWRNQQRIRSHRDQVESNVVAKLKPNAEREERTTLSTDTARSYASRLALAAILMRKLTLRYDASTDDVEASESALDVSRLLSDANPDEQKTLLERPLFGFASYGRVRFHHRSVVEYLAAARLETLLARGVPIKSIKRLLFTETAQGLPIVQPSMRPVAAWLALTRDTIFEEIVSRDPSVVLDFGDPQSLRPEQRILALEAFITRYKDGEWRGLSIPHVQVRRFASLELGETIQRHWKAGIANHEIRDLILDLIAAGPICACGDIAYEVALDQKMPSRLRSRAVSVLVSLADRRVPEIADALATLPTEWDEDVTRRAFLHLFPKHLPLPTLSKILARIREGKSTVGSLTYHLPQMIEEVAADDLDLDALRDLLTTLVRVGTCWQPKDHPHLKTDRHDLLDALLAVCRRQCDLDVRTAPWISSTLLALRLNDRHQRDNERVKVLEAAIADLPAPARELAFWAEHAFLSSMSQPDDPWSWLYTIVNDGGLPLSAEKDEVWVLRRLADPNELLFHRQMMLWTVMTGLICRTHGSLTTLRDLLVLVADSTVLTQTVEDRMKPSPRSEEMQRQEQQFARRQMVEERKTAKARASWVEFWKEIAANPDELFKDERAPGTAWNLWRVMERTGSESRSTGWNREYIESQFGKAVADKLRAAMLKVWRNDRPTLRSERPEGEKGTFLTRWQFGLAAIEAEAEDADWAKKLTPDEAQLACRYAPIQLNGFPFWLETLAASHPNAVEKVLGGELTLSLGENAGENHSSALQDIQHASPKVAGLFLPRIREWVETMLKPDTSVVASDLLVDQAIDILMKFGSEHDHSFIEQAVARFLQGGLEVKGARIWLPLLFRLNAIRATEVLEAGLAGITPGKETEAVAWFARLFGRDHDSNAVYVKGAGFTPSALLRLTRLAYIHVRPTDDTYHEGTFTPDTRDNAQNARNALLGAILDLGGADGWAVKMSLINDPLFAHFADRGRILAEEKAAEEADAVSVTEADFKMLDTYGEAPPNTRDTMFQLMRDRLEDIDDLLLQDTSPRENWAVIEDERVLRRALAHELNSRSNHLYTVDQEAATADEKETDIRLRSTSSPEQGTIELKIGEKPRSAAELRGAMKDQLLTKYLAPERTRSGCLVISVATDRTWLHPDTQQKMGLNELIEFLNVEARKLEAETGGSVRLMAKGLNLRPRLATERDTATASKALYKS